MSSLPFFSVVMKGEEVRSNTIKKERMREKGKEIFKLRDQKGKGELRSEMKEWRREIRVSEKKRRGRGEERFQSDKGTRDKRHEGRLIYT